MNLVHVGRIRMRICEERVRHQDSRPRPRLHRRGVELRRGTLLAVLCMLRSFCGAHFALHLHSPPLTPLHCALALAWSDHSLF